MKKKQSEYELVSKAKMGELMKTKGSNSILELHISSTHG